MSNFLDDQARQRKLEAAVGAASAAMKHYPRGPNGLVPDHIWLSPECRAAHEAYKKAFAALRNFNATFVKRYKRELREQRRARDRQRMAARVTV